MKRIYACIAIVAVLLCVSFYSSFQVQKFADAVSEDLEHSGNFHPQQQYPVSTAGAFRRGRPVRHHAGENEPSAQNRRFH